jgi:hypothetical protein
MTKNWKIEVHVGEPGDKEVFIARPWSKLANSDYIERNILSAVTKAGLKPIDTNYKKSDANFTRSIKKLIRKAAVVVGVCSPEGNGGQPNSNVTYEIGLAQSLGKPTVILSTNKSSVIADLQGQDILLYDEACKVDFDDTLVRYLNEAVKRSDSSGLVDADSYDDICAVPIKVEQNQNALVTAFPILRFTTETLNIFSQENRNLDQIDRYTQTLSHLSKESERERLIQALQQIKNYWREFVTEEELFVSRKISDLLKEEDEIKGAIKDLKRIPAATGCEKLLTELAEDIDGIVNHLNIYVKQIDLWKQLMNDHQNEFIMPDKKDDIARNLNDGCWKLIVESGQLTGLAGKAIPQTYQILDKLGDARV